MTTQIRLFSFPLLSLVGALVSALAVTSPAREARAAPPDEELPMLAPRLDHLDDPPPEEGWPPRAPLPAAGALEIALEAGVAQIQGGDHAVQAMLLASVPLERIARPFIGQRAGASPGPALPARPAPAPRASAPSAPIADGAAPRAAPSPSPAPPAQPTTPDDGPPPAPPPSARVTPELARGAVAAALRRAGLADPEARLDALASRARASALVPELRLRVARELEQAQSLAPTEYDPARTTATGGASLWLEARATWRLDRAVFADEEITLERLRRERADAQRRLTDRVLALLFAWQRARTREADPARTPEERLDATLDAIEAEATLDILTDGWFTRRSAPP